MAEEIKAKVVETEEKSLQEKEEVVQKNSGFDEESQMYKVNLNEPPKQETDAVQGKSTDDSDVVVEQSEDSPSSEEVVEEVRDTEEEVAEEEKPIIEEIPNETNETDTINEAGVAGSAEAPNPAPQQEEILQEEETQEPVEYPENIQDLVKFMNDTGGTLEDYVALNKDYELSLIHI